MGRGRFQSTIRLAGRSVRVLLGFLFLWGAVHKAYEPQDAYRLVATVLPWAPPVSVVRGFIAVEWALGSLLLFGYHARRLLAVSVFLIAALTAVLFYAKSQGFTGNCGCLGIQSGVSDAITRNGVLSAITLLGYFAHPSCSKSQRYRSERSEK